MKQSEVPFRSTKESIQSGPLQAVLRQRRTPDYSHEKVEAFPKWRLRIVRSLSLSLLIEPIVTRKIPALTSNHSQANSINHHGMLSTYLQGINFCLFGL